MWKAKGATSCYNSLFFQEDSLVALLDAIPIHVVIGQEQTEGGEADEGSPEGDRSAAKLIAVHLADLPADDQLQLVSRPKRSSHGCAVVFRAPEAQP